MSNSWWPHRLYVAHQAPLSVGILQERILEWVSISFSGGTSSSGMEPRPLSPVFAGRFFITEPPGKALRICTSPLFTRPPRVSWGLTCAQRPTEAGGRLPHAALQHQSPEWQGGRESLSGGRRRSAASVATGSPACRSPRQGQGISQRGDSVLRKRSGKPPMRPVLSQDSVLLPTWVTDRMPLPSPPLQTSSRQLKRHCCAQSLPLWLCSPPGSSDHGIL